MRPEERLERLEMALQRLRELAEGNIVVVEGARDVAALGALGIEGQHVPLHRGDPLEAVVDWLAGRAQETGSQVVLLTDWDRTGGRLARRLHDGLVGRVPVDITARRNLARACHCHAVEEVPGERAALRRQIHDMSNNR